MMLSLPNLLTLFRIAMIPVFVIVFFVPFTWAPPATAVLFALAGFTDWLDGFLARKLSQSSPFGEFLDPIADKLIVTVALLLLLQADPRILLSIPIMVIIGREIAVSGLREWMAGLGVRHRIAVSWLGKFKTAAQMAAIFMMLYRYPVAGFSIYDFGVALLFISAVLTLWSMFFYLRTAWPDMVRNGAGKP